MTRIFFWILDTTKQSQCVMCASYFHRQFHCVPVLYQNTALLRDFFLLFVHKERQCKNKKRVPTRNRNARASSCSLNKILPARPEVVQLIQAASFPTPCCIRRTTNYKVQRLPIKQTVAVIIKSTTSIPVKIIHLHVTTPSPHFSASPSLYLVSI